MKQKLKGVLIKNLENMLIVSKIEFNDNLETMYKLIGCDLVEMPIRYINHIPYTFIVDEEFLLKEKPKLTAISSDFKTEGLCGNIIIVSGYTDKKGNLLSLNDNDYNNIFKAIAKTKELLIYDFK